MERQLLFLLDYDLRMDEPELLEHFAPFLCPPAVKSVAPLFHHATRPAPSTPVREPHCYTNSNGLLTPSPTPTSRRGSQLAHRSAAPPAGCSAPMSEDDLPRPSNRRYSPAQARYASAMPQPRRTGGSYSALPLTPGPDAVSDSCADVPRQVTLPFEQAFQHPAIKRRSDSLGQLLKRSSSGNLGRDAMAAR